MNITSQEVITTKKPLDYFGKLVNVDEFCYCSCVWRLAIFSVHSDSPSKFCFFILDCFHPFFSRLSCPGATGSSHCNHSWFDVHVFRVDQTICMFGEILELNYPIVGHERFNRRQHGHVSVNSLARNLRESLYFGGKFFLHL